MTPRKKLANWLVVLVGLHCIIMAAGFFSPYDPVEQDRDRPYLPPMHLHMRRCARPPPSPSDLLSASFAPRLFRSI